MKPASSYRAARRNASHSFVWTGIQARYEPVQPHGKLYRPNGQREVCRRIRQAHMRSLKQQKALAA